MVRKHTKTQPTLFFLEAYAEQERIQWCASTQRHSQHPFFLKAYQNYVYLNVSERVQRLRLFSNTHALTHTQNVHLHFNHDHPHPKLMCERHCNLVPSLSSIYGPLLAN